MTARQFRPNDVVFNNICGAIYDEDILRRALDYHNAIFSRHYVSIYLSSLGYPMIRFNLHSYRLHRIIGEYIFDDMRGVYQYHHIDGNKLNTLSENLQQLTLSEHQILHGSNRYVSQEQKQKLSMIRKGVKPGNIRAVMMFDEKGNYIDEFPSTQDAAKYIGVARTAITNNLNNRSKFCHNFKFIYKDEYISSTTSNPRH